MNSIKQVFQNGNAFMPFTVAGYPNKEKSKEIIQALVDSGADIIELGIPFSDPMADGPTIMEADEKALENNFKVEDAFEIAKEFKETPIVLMAYANTLHAYGYQKFLRRAEEAGVNGLIIPDMPPKEHEKELGEIDTEIKSIFLVTQNNSKERIKKINQATEGFAYLVSVKGTTGARENFSQRTEKLIEQTEDMTVPRAIGFGISSKEHAKSAVKAGADGVIVGSALLDEYMDEGIEAMRELAKELNEGTEDM